MNTIIIESTHIAPQVILNPEGTIEFTGRCIMEDTIKFFRPIIDWINQLNCPELTLEVRLEYMNTSSTKQILTMIKAIAANPLIRGTYIKWFYEADDEDMLDIGKDFESLVNIPFDFYELSQNAA